MQGTEMLKKITVRGLVLFVLSLALIGVLGIVARNSLASDDTLPPAIAQQVTHPVFMPGDDTTATVERPSINFQADADLLSYTATLMSGAKIFVNQQPTPESFIDIPQAYDKLLGSLQPYANFESLNGKVTLTKPKELQGEQSAVMNTKGTLMFIRSDTEISQDDWRKLFNNLKII